MRYLLENGIEGVFSKRQQSDAGSSSGSPVIVVVVVVIVVLITLTLLIYAVFRKRQNSRKYLPGDNLLTKFNRWRGSSRGEYSAQLQPNPGAPSLIGQDGRRSRNTSRNPSPDRASARTRTRETDPERGDLSLSLGGGSGIVVAEGGLTTGNSPNTNSTGVDRNTSVRSVMTLPAYTPAARATEQTLAREGERGGIDVVLEFPESIDDEEQRRDNEMESLYQIRRARRQEQAEREERRIARREARVRGDYETLQRLQAESRRRAESAASGEFVTSAALIAEHQALQANRERRVSAVQYAALGVARHDGSRLRAGSTDSDNRPLLDSAASISGMSLTRPYSSHSRGRSASSVLSVSTRASEETHRPGTDAEGFEFISLEPTTSHSRSRASSTSGRSLHHTPPSSDERDASDVGFQIPNEQPPEYEDAPAYSSPVATRPPGGGFGRPDGPPRLPSLTTVPSIEVTGAFGPVSRETSATRR